MYGTHVFDQLDGILVNCQVNDWSVTTNVEDCVKVGSGERGELDGILDEFLSGFVVEELGAEIIALECFNGGLVERYRSAWRIALIGRWEAYRVQRRFTASRGSEGKVEAILQLIVRVSQFGEVPSGGLSG
jgi:hypothetical protein